MSAIFALSVDQLEDPERFARCWATVPEERRKMVGRFRHPEDQRRSLGAGWLLEQALRMYFGADHPPIVRETGGKPVVSNRPDWHFSLSHAGNWAVCGVDSRPIGVDVEEIRPDGLQIATRFFAPEEAAYLEELPEDRQAAAFTCLWTRKESYIKYTGEGLRRKLSSFEVLHEKEDEMERSGPWYHRELHCWFTGYALPDGIPVTLCTAHNLVPLEIGLWTMEE